ncbi:MAG TPA: aminotransferase class I/II-fold pyridoxal phosphate-dependent enzyme [Nitrososphaerales archaeon]|nr:aminotransferase class I/II-fold pyridoxal phosphate-dependent enzyme [Nitrososphaerales archaeon]
MAKKKEELTRLRGEVALKTIEIIRLIGERNNLAERIGRVKRSEALPLADEKVEDKLLREVLREGKKRGVERQLVVKILSSLISEAKRVQGLDSGGGRASPMSVLAKVVKLQREGKKVIRLDVGEPDFPPPAAVVEACYEALMGEKTHYTESRGIPELLEALRAYVKSKNHFDAKPEQLVVTVGGRFAVYAAIATAVKEGDSAILIEPAWPAYKEQIEFVGGKAISVQTRLDDGWGPSVKEVEERVRPNTKAIILNYPSNPTGKIVKPSLFREILQVANEKKLTVISDEVYDSYSFAPCPSILEGGADRFILTSSFSKTWAMTGFRVGYAVCDPQSADRIVRLASLMYTSVPEFIQYGAIKALESEEEATRNREAMRERIAVASRELDRIPGLQYYRPDGAMYVFPQSRDESFDASTFAERLLNEDGVSVIPGGGFGRYPRCFRISLGSPKEVIVEGIRRIGEKIP